MNASPHYLRRLSLTVLICLGGIAVAATTAHAGGSCGHADHAANHDHDRDDRYSERDYRDRDYERDYRDRDRDRDYATTPVGYDKRRGRAARQCRQASFDQRQLFSQRLAQLQRTEARTIGSAYLPRTKEKARRVAQQARAQAQRLTSRPPNRPWRSRDLACRDDVRRFRAATQTLDRSIDKLLRLAARDARVARRYGTPRAPAYVAPRAPRTRVYTAPRARPTRVVYR